MKNLNYESLSGTRINNRGLGKPNEDLYLVDTEHHIFILLDGITRVHKEYLEQPGKSAASEVGEIFLQTAYAYLLQNLDAPDPDSLLHQAALRGNDAIRRCRTRRSLEEWQFYPAVLGILAILRGDTLHYAFLGDSLGLHIQSGEKHFFGCQKQIETISKMGLSKAEIYSTYVNHPENPLGYGIFNGDETMEAMLEHGVLYLQQGDTVILCSDGLSQYLKHTSAECLVAQTTEQILNESVIYDVPPYASYADDKAIIKLTFQ